MRGVGHERGAGATVPATARPAAADRGGPAPAAAPSANGAHAGSGAKRKYSAMGAAGPASLWVSSLPSTCAAGQVALHLQSVSLSVHCGAAFQGLLTDLCTFIDAKAWPRLGDPLAGSADAQHSIAGIELMHRVPEPCTMFAAHEFVHRSRRACNAGGARGKYRALNR